MQKITDIYREYKIMPILQQHQLRVTAVASLICENISVSVDKESIIKACLLHDMGNIIKFIIGSIPEAVEEEGLEYWHQVQNEFIAKYGKDEHHATLLIAEELGVGKKVYDLINCIGFHTAKENLECEDFNRKICAYADMRVTPSGVDSLENRLSNLKERYHGKNKTSNLDFGYEKDSLEEHVEARELFEDSLKKIEKQIFEKCSLNPEDISDEAVKSVVDYLKSVEI
jgi:hypothetical protein